MRGCLKVVIIVIAVIIVLIIAVVGVTSFLMKSSRGDREEVLKSKSQDAKMALVVYQPSMTKIAGNVAHWIAQGLNDAGYEVVINYPGKHMPADISKYSVAVFGSPVYAGQVNAALSDYMKRINDYSRAKVILFSTGGTDQKPELDGMAGLLKGTVPFASVKFKVSDGDVNKTKAYKLGTDAAGK